MSDSSNDATNNLFKFVKRPFNASNDNSDTHSSESEVRHTYSQRNKRAYASLNNDECDSSDDDSLDLGKKRIRLKGNTCIDKAQEDSIDSEEVSLSSSSSSTSLSASSSSDHTKLSDESAPIKKKQATLASMGFGEGTSMVTNNNNNTSSSPIITPPDNPPTVYTT